VAVETIHFSDPACPWAYSASPALAALRWRFGDQLDWRLVTIGLSESTEAYERFGYTPARAAQGNRRFRRYGMPMATAPRERLAASGRACRAIVATRLHEPALEYDAFRALQFAVFTTTLLLDTDDAIREALRAVPGLDQDAIVAAIEDADVEEAYQRDREETRRAAGSPTEAQGKATDRGGGVVRYTAPSLIFRDNGRTLEAGGFQPLEAYDVVLANLDPTLTRRSTPDSPLAILEALPYAATTQEVARCMADGNDAPDRAATEDALIELTGEGEVRRTPLGDDALWSLAGRADQAVGAATSGAGAAAGDSSKASAISS
jgi:2-hydroxychromene-2-carboxylate isomerase